MSGNHLPFLLIDETGAMKSTWNVKPTGDWSKDCETGVSYYRLAADLQNPILMLRIFQGMMESGHKSGIETGFISASVGMM